jgi:hypothetical protein
MKSPTRIFRLLGLITCACLLPLHAEVPAEKITALEQALTASKDESSAARKRLSVKRAVRDAEELLKEHATAANRFVLLEVIFRARQELVKLDNDPENRTALLDTCKLLAAAPEEFAMQRFDAELLLSQSESVREGAEEGGRIKALQQLVDRYRGTTAEAKSIKVAVVIAMELGDTQFAEKLRIRIEERFAADIDMIAFQRQHFGGQVIGAPISGTFERADGKWTRFPMDAMGKSTMVLFWSKDDSGKKHLEGFAAAAKQLQAELLGRMQFVSFNLDNLHDAGQSILKEVGVDWPALKLPGGTENPYFKTFARKSPAAISISPAGYAALVLEGSTKNNNGRNVEITADIDYSRWLTSSLSRSWTEATYMSQMSSLFSGEFLVHDQKSSSLPKETLSAIQECFLPPIRRAHAPNAELITLYQNAESLTAKAIAANASSPDLWLLRNYRITALNCLWKLTNDSDHLDRALEESKAALAANPTAAAQVAPQFCLTREALRQPDAKPREVIAQFLTTLGGDKAPATALAAASLLALETADRELHEQYRTQILARYAEDPSIYPVVALLLDRYHRYWLHQVPFSAGWSYGRREKYFQTHGQPEDAQRKFNAELTALDGKTVSLPKDYAGKWLILLFPSTEPGEKTPLPKIVTGQLDEQKRYLTTKRGTDDLQIITVILDDDATRVTTNYLPAPVTSPVLMIPGGMNNPLVAQLGLLNEPGNSNTVLVRPDGTIAASLSSLNRHNETIANIIEWHDEKAVIDALTAGNIEEAKRIAFLRAPTEPPVSTDPKKKNVKPIPPSLTHLRARALVYLALQEYDKALADIEQVISLQLGTDGGMSLRTKDLEEAEQFRDQLLKLRAPKKEEK